MDYLVWNINPNIIDVFGIQIRWYGALFAASFLLGSQIMEWIYRSENLSIKHIDRLFMFLIVSTIIGARLGHCFFYDPNYYLQNPLKIFAIWEGGLASHGGAIGIFTGLYLYQRKTQESYLWLLDRLSIPAALAACFIRLGNLFNSEILGIPTSVPWAIIFQRVDSIPRHPAQLYEALSYAAVFIILLLIYRKKRASLKGGLLFSTFLICVFSARFLIEFVKTKQAAYASDVVLSTGQLLSLPFILIGIAMLYMALKRQVSSHK